MAGLLDYLTEAMFINPTVPVRGVPLPAPVSTNNLSPEMSRQLDAQMARMAAEVRAREVARPANSYAPTPATTHSESLRQLENEYRREQEGKRLDQQQARAWARDVPRPVDGSRVDRSGNKDGVAAPRGRRAAPAAKATAPAPAAKAVEAAPAPTQAPVQQAAPAVIPTPTNAPVAATSMGADEDYVPYPSNCANGRCAQNWMDVNGGEARDIAMYGPRTVGQQNARMQNLARMSMFSGAAAQFEKQQAWQDAMQDPETTTYMTRLMAAGATPAAAQQMALQENLRRNGRHREAQLWFGDSSAAVAADNNQRAGFALSTGTSYTPWGLTNPNAGGPVNAMAGPGAGFYVDENGNWKTSTVSGIPTTAFPSAVVATGGGLAPAAAAQNQGVQTAKAAADASNQRMSQFNDQFEAQSKLLASGFKAQMDQLEFIQKQAQANYDAALKEFGETKSPEAKAKAEKSCNELWNIYSRDFTLYTKAQDAGAKDIPEPVKPNCQRTAGG